MNATANKIRIRSILLIFSVLIVFPTIISFFNYNNAFVNDDDSTHNQREIVQTSATVDDFQYYKTITIDHTKVSGASNLINYTLLFSIVDSDLHLNAQPDGDDIAFFDGSTQLAYEIELFDPDYDATHARLVAWVLVPSLSPSVNTTIYMYYGNSTMGPQENPTGVWNPNYKGVWHLNTTLLDSTVNNNDGTNYQANDVSAHIANGRDYDGNDDYSNMGSGSTIDNIFNGGATVSVWIYPEGWGGGTFGRILDKASETSGTNGWVMCLDGGVSPWYNQLLFYRGFSTTRGLWMSGDNTITLSQWQYIVITYDDSSTSNDPGLYINGVYQSGKSGWEDSTPSGSASSDAIQSLFIGNFMSGGRGFDGLIDEVRVSSGIKTSSWIQTEFNNQNDPSSFYSLSAQHVIDNSPPTITINSPLSDTLCGPTSPNFNVEISDDNNIDTQWYQLSNGSITTINTTFTTNGSINQARWNEMGNGTVTLQFFANDTSGNVGSSELMVRKDIQSPSIVINSPNNFDLCGTPAPNFDVEIWDINGVDDMWYTLNNSKETYFTANGTISPSIWSTCGNGTISIKFYANDSLGNEGYSEVIVRKEVNSPTIQINSPHSYDLFGKTAPDFNVEIWDDNGVDDMWYTLNNGIETYFTVNSTISPSLWTTYGNGTVSIKFYANNSLGNGGFSEVIVRKDVISPVITINTPDPYNLYGYLAPAFNVVINDPNGIDSKWYTLDGGITNTTFTSNGIINQTRWNEMGNGTTIVSFYANDSLGNVGSSEVPVYKDIIAPTITINSPNPYDLFGAIAPNFNIITTDSSGISVRWYTLDDGITNITCGTTGQINPLLWGFQANGTVSIKFYARDLMGNEGFSEVTVRKDIDPPSIIINNPTLNQSFDTTAPTFNIEILDINGIDTMWYTLDNGLTNTIFTTNGSIDQAIWDLFGDGSITIWFYANNSIGTTGSSEVSVMKDIDAPLIAINTPSNNTWWNHAPIINILASDFNFDELWFSINSYNITLTNNVNYQLDISIWNSLPQGFFQLHLYANDSIGHLNDSILLTLYKDTIAPDSPILTTYPQGEVSLPITFDWEDGSDPSGISQYRLILDTEPDPFTTPGFTFEINITNTGLTSSYYELNQYLAFGMYYFFIYQIDGAGNQGSFASDTFTVKQQPGTPSEFPWWILLFLIVPFGVVIAVISLRKSKKKQVQVVIVDKQLEALKEQKKQLELNAKAAMKSGNYKQAAQYYEQCRVISNKLLEEGYQEEKDKYRSYEMIETQLQKKMAAIPLTYHCLNALMTAYFTQIGIKYYSNPDIYAETQKAINGLILNDSKFFQTRLSNATNGQELMDELKITPDMIEPINAIQFFFTNDLSEDELIKACKAFQNPQIFLIIVGFPWPALEYEKVMTIPMDNSIRYRDNIRIINIDLLVRLVGMEGQFKNDLLEIIELDFDYEELQKIEVNIRTELHDTEELKQDLKQKEWFFLL